MYTVIFKVSVWLEETGFRENTKDVPVKETALSFLADGRRISKENINKIDTDFVETHNSIRYYMYCHPNHKIQAIIDLKKHIYEKVKKYKAEIENLEKYI